jgi:hypothetical protein
MLRHQTEDVHRRHFDMIGNEFARGASERKIADRVAAAFRGGRASAAAQAVRRLLRSAVAPASRSCCAFPPRALPVLKSACAIHGIDDGG